MTGTAQSQTHDVWATEDAGAGAANADEQGG